MKVAREPQAPPASANEDSNLIESEELPQSSKKYRPTVVDLSQRRTVPLPSTRPQDDLSPADQRQRSEACRKTLERLHRRQLGSANSHEDCLGAPSVSRNTQQGTEEVHNAAKMCVGRITQHNYDMRITQKGKHIEKANLGVTQRCWWDQRGWCRTTDVQRNVCQRNQRCFRNDT